MVYVTKEVGLTLVVVDRDTLTVPVLQYVLVTEALGVEEEDVERVGDTV